MRTASPTAPGDLARRSAGPAAPAVRDIGPTGRAPSPPLCPSYRLRPPRRTERHDDRDETDGHRGADRRPSSPGSSPAALGPSLARRGGDGDRRDRRPRARRPPRARGPRRRRPGRPDPQAVQALLGPAASRASRTVVEIDGPPDRRRALRADRRAVHGRVARPDARPPRALVTAAGASAVPRRRLQAAHLAVLLPGPRAGGAAPARRGEGGDRPADRHRADGRARPRAGPRGRRRDPDRRAQHAELHAADRGRPHGHARCCSSAGCRRRSRSC